jgi:hypothetical protein
LAAFRNPGRQTRIWQCRVDSISGERNGGDKLGRDGRTAHQSIWSLFGMNVLEAEVKSREVLKSWRVEKLSSCSEFLSKSRL